MLLLFLFFTGIVNTYYDFSGAMIEFKTKNSYQVIGSQLHNFLENPIVYKNKNADDKVDNPVDFGGIEWGRLGFEFSKFSGNKLAKNHNISVSQKSAG